MIARSLVSQQVTRVQESDRMHPTGAAGLPATAEGEVQAMQSMDWLFKKERIYLLAQFWQQRATLAEKEVTTLKEQLASPAQSQPLQATVPSPSKTPNGNTKEHDDIHIVPTANQKEPLTAENVIRNCPSVDEIENLIENTNKMEMAATTRTNGSNNNSTRSSPVVNHSGPALEVELAAKEKEISQLVEDVQRLQASLSALQEAHTQQMRRLESRLDEKRAHIARLEARLDGQREYEDMKREARYGNMLRSVDLTTTPPSNEMKPFHPMMLDRPKPPESITSPVHVQRERESDSVEMDRSMDRREMMASPSSPPPPPPLNNNTSHHNANSGAPGGPGRPTSPPEPRGFRFADDLGPLPPGALVGRLGDSLIPKGDPMEARLQEMLRYNMDKYATQNLDTLHISRRVRELLSVHNIGQRLFAKYVLGLSQGTVSELLSKPKPWDKLTEKGRDSYRKMHAWACDEAAVMLLKSLIPKKVGKEGGMPGFNRPDGDMNDDRLAHIFNEASHFMKSSGTLQNDDSRSNDDSGSPRTQCPSPFSNKDSSQNRRLKKYENDDIPQEKVVRIYQEEFAKLMGRRMEDIHQQRRESFPGGGMPPHMERPQDDNIRMALEAYHRELAKIQQAGPGGPSGPGVPGSHGGPVPPAFPGLLALQHQAMQQAQHHAQHQAQQHHHNPHINGTGSVQDLSIPKEKMSKMNGITHDLDKEKSLDAEEAMRHAGSAFSLVRPKIEPGSQQSTGSSASSPLGNAILPPAITPNDDFGGSAAASPLQRMASITNSLISQPSTPSHHTSSQRPMKAVLPPITQQQFDLFNSLNTEDIVRRVKESLSQYSISQRLFGESVLGLSQGSVSDLLARPKPWHMLTQKGREPFIRMKMFLEDDNAVHKLVASQYKIAPEKLMRTGSYAGGPPCPPSMNLNMNKPLPPTQKMISDATHLLNKMQHEQQVSLLPPNMQLGPGGPSQSPMLLTPPGFPPHHAITLTQQPDLKHKQPSLQHPQHQQHPQHSHVSHSPMHHQGSVMRALHQHISPSVYEMAALTQDLDTQTITTKIKEALLANNIGQKIFGEAVLGLSQGSVSELLSKPKPWHMLSIKGREPFIRMQLWLTDAHNIDRLQALKNERREANKRRRSSGPGAQDNSSDTSSNDTSEFYHSNSPGPNPSGPPSAKKQRVLFSEEQKEALRLAFALDPYPSMPTIEFLASELGLSSRTITNWFHNHRMRLKQQVPHGASGPPGTPGELPQRDQSGSQVPFDPVQFRLLLNRRLLELQKERLGLAGVPLPYPPYFAANSNLAALISRGVMPTGEMDLAALDEAVKEQMSGLDLSMPALKRDPDEEYDDDADPDADDVESNLGSDDSLYSRGLADDGKSEPKLTSTPLAGVGGGGGGRSSRRKPAAPQWVNPEWQDDKAPPTSSREEVIINGVCVMKTEDYGRREEETVRIEPAPAPATAPAPPLALTPQAYVPDDLEEVDADEAHGTDRAHLETERPHTVSAPLVHLAPLPSHESEAIKTESSNDRWDYN